jgi:hypothetical protein
VDIMDECDQLRNIFAKSIVTAKANASGGADPES